MLLALCWEGAVVEPCCRGAAGRAVLCSVHFLRFHIFAKGRIVIEISLLLTQSLFFSL